MQGDTNEISKLFLFSAAIRFRGCSRRSPYAGVLSHRYFFANIRSWFKLLSLWRATCSNIMLPVKWFILPVIKFVQSRWVWKRYRPIHDKIVWHRYTKDHPEWQMLRQLTLTYWRAANSFGDPYCMNAILQMLYTSGIAWNCAEDGPCRLLSCTTIVTRSL
jgi:hypothetical protein